MTDAALVDLARRGDRDAFGALYRRYYSYVLYYVRGRATSLPWVDPDDIVQMAFVKAWLNVARFDGRRCKLPTWVCAIARQLLIDAWRSNLKRVDDEPLSGTMHARDEYRLVEVQIDLDQAAADLTPEQADVVWLRFEERCEFPEMAARLGTSERACRVRLHRARKKLRERIE